MTTPQTIDVPAGLALPRLASRVFDTPLLIHEGKLSQILRVLGPRLGYDNASQAEPLAHRTPAEHDEMLAAVGRTHLQGVKWEWDRDGRFYHVGNVAVIPIVGTLVQRGGAFDALSGLVSYDRIEHSVESAMADSYVDELFFDYDTPGGEAAGAFDAADRLFEQRGRKPMTAVVNEFAASGGMLLASTADQIVIPRTGYAGSVGVVTAHVDMSKALEKRGLAVTFVYAGQKKVDGNPYEPLPERVRAEWQAEIDAMYEIFVSTVARNLKTDPERIRATQAGMYMGRAAVDAGLAHRVNTLANEVHNATTVRRGGAFRLNHDRGEASMSDAERAEREKAIAEARAAGVAQGKAEAKAEHEKELGAAIETAVAGERDRIKAIVTCDEAKGRADLATHIAFETATSADDAKKLLAAAPQAKTSGALAAAMAAHGTPGIKTQELGDEKESTVKVDSSQFFAKLNEPYQRAIQGESTPRAS